MKNKLIYPVMALILLSCLLSMPYGYYILVRFIATIVFGYLCIKYLNQRDEVYAIVFGVLTLMFQPFFKLTLGHDLWNLVDVIVAIFLIVVWIKQIKSK